MAISITPLSGGNTPADGSDPRTFPAIWNATATQLEGVATDLDTLEATVGDYDLNALNGVGITTPVQGDVLTYNGTSWVNGNPAGSVIQFTSLYSTASPSTSSSSYVDTGVSWSMTPLSTSSKIFILATGTLCSSGTTSVGDIALCKGDTNVVLTQTENFVRTLTTTGGSASAFTPYSLSYVEDASLWSNIKLRIRNFGTGATYFDASYPTQLTIMEIAA